METNKSNEEKITYLDCRAGRAEYSKKKEEKRMLEK